MKRLEFRHKAKQAVRAYFDSQGFIEIDSPIVIPANAIETFIDPFEVPGLGELRTSPELYHKRLLAHGATKIYELGHVFRDEPKGRLHLQEFTLLEWYRVGGTLKDLIQDCEQLFRLAMALSTGGEGASRSEAGEGFEIRTLQDLWLEHAKIDLRAALVADDLVHRVQSAGFTLRPGADFFDAFHHVMLSTIEPRIGQEVPCVVMRWPRKMAALARICTDDVYFAERFEIYYQGIELANAFLELTDPVEQRGRFLEEQEQRRKLGKQGGKLDEDFLSILGSMPAAAGIAVGFDRLLMCAVKARQIDELDIFFQKTLNV